MPTKNNVNRWLGCWPARGGRWEELYLPRAASGLGCAQEQHAQQRLAENRLAENRLAENRLAENRLAENRLAENAAE